MRGVANGLFGYRERNPRSLFPSLRPLTFLEKESLLGKVWSTLEDSSLIGPPGRKSKSLTPSLYVGMWLTSAHSFIF